MNNDNQIIIYTDGSSLGNPGPGGWAAVLMWKGKRKEISGGYRLTTNNRMEIYAVIQALKAVKNNKKHDILLHTDSRYVADAINLNWAKDWRAKGWKRTRKDKALNPDLWAILLDELDKHNVTVKWVKAHVGIPENERCDSLCTQAAAANNLPEDEYYEQNMDDKK